ncbi:MAG: deoxyribose-phosphate aldolase, partial [Christensenella sp.]
MKREELAKKIESRIFDINIDYPNVTNLCYEAERYGFCAVQVFPCMVELCVKTIQAPDIKVNALISYPHGGFSIEQKAAEVKDAVKKGATEVEVVMNTREAKTHNYDYIEREMKAVMDAANGKATVKFIIEIEVLTDEEATETCKAAVRAGVDYIVTSTGLYHTLDENKNDVPLYANEKDIKLIRAAVGDKVKIQAQGYISSAALAEKLLTAGADRITTEY